MQYSRFDPISHTQTYAEAGRDFVAVGEAYDANGESYAVSEREAYHAHSD